MRSSAGWVAANGKDAALGGRMVQAQAITGRITSLQATLIGGVLRAAQFSARPLHGLQLARC